MTFSLGASTMTLPYSRYRPSAMARAAQSLDAHLNQEAHAVVPSPFEVPLGVSFVLPNRRSLYIEFEYLDEPKVDTTDRPAGDEMGCLVQIDSRTRRVARLTLPDASDWLEGGVALKANLGDQPWAQHWTERDRAALSASGWIIYDLLSMIPEDVRSQIREAAASLQAQD